MRGDINTLGVNYGANGSRRVLDLCHTSPRPIPLEQSQPGGRRDSKPDRWDIDGNNDDDEIAHCAEW